jgi:predicted N-acetyltransferase YhbS
LTETLVDIRDERPGDAPAIHDVTKTAFADMRYSSHTEQHIVDALRAADALALSLVAERDDEIVGHVAFSRVRIGGEPGDWFGLGPLSVRPALHGQGIGSLLVREGLSRLRALGAGGCVLLGHRAYYARFGFTHDLRLTYGGKAHPNFQRLGFGEAIPEGDVTYHPAFETS